MHADHRLLLWRLVDARIPAEIAQLETHAGTTQRAAVDYAIERSGFRDFFLPLAEHSSLGQQAQQDCLLSQVAASEVETASSANFTCDVSL
jgi:hypothetical protein